MKQGALICALLLSLRTSNAQQNIIVNGSFENHNSCMLSHVDDSPPWLGSYCLPLLFDTCAFSSSVNVPVNLDSLLGYQWPHSGNAYAGFNLFVTGITAREYLVYPINGELTAGKNYCLKFYLN